MNPSTRASMLRLGSRTVLKGSTSASVVWQCAAIPNVARSWCPPVTRLKGAASRGASRKLAFRPHCFLPVVARLRAYHSYDHPRPPCPFGATEAAILAAAYSHVPEHGFTMTSLAFGARDVGFPGISTSFIPDGEFGLIKWHMVKQQGALAPKAKDMFATKDEGARTFLIPEKAEMLMWERLMGNKQIIRHWQQALAIVAHPNYVPSSIKLLASLADEIVFLSGDKAVDPTWYTSRAGISAIYASTELFMTNDHSEGFKDTREFLGRRMEEARSAMNTLRDIGQWVGFNAMGALNVARSWGMKI